MSNSTTKDIKNMETIQSSTTSVPGYPFFLIERLIHHTLQYVTIEQCCLLTDMFTIFHIHDTSKVQINYIYNVNCSLSLKPVV